jgi:SAM-dependent methyltransferase
MSASADSRAAPPETRAGAPGAPDAPPETRAGAPDAPPETRTGAPDAPPETRAGARAAAPANPVRDFYDGLAPRYDREQEEGGGAALRQVERQRILATLPDLLGDRRDQWVLELGAGTGRFTGLLAERADQVVAVDLSRRMLARLQARLAQSHRPGGGQPPVHVLAADLTALPLGERPFDLVCAFSSLEYVPDLPATLRALAARLRPGGALYLTTAHRCLLRRFVQIGNALRQGVWLHAYRRRALARALRAAGLEVQALETHHLRLGPLGGMLLEARAQKPESSGSSNR